MDIAAVIDTVLDRSIALGYGNIGLALRRRLPGWAAELPRMDGKTVLVTGAASGLGLEACRGYARLGARVLAVARNASRASDARALITEEVGDADVEAIACDVSSLAELRALAARLNAVEPHLDVLVNNAGVMPDERTRSVDGHELMFSTHVLAPFALTLLLEDLLKRSAPARVINVSSGGMYAQGLPADDLESERVSYSSKRLYARTKREQVVVTEMLAERLQGTGVVVHSMHPGWVDTKGVREWLPVFRIVTRPIIRDPEDGADTIVWMGAAGAPLRSTGKFWHDRRMRPTHYALGAGEESAEDRRRLWVYCQAALGAESSPAPVGGS